MRTTSFFFVTHFSLKSVLLLLSLQLDLFSDVGNGVRALCPDRLLRPSAFVVGQPVTVAKRMMAGVNKEGGTARVTAVTFECDESTLYEIKYVVNSSTEQRLPEALLSVPTAPTPRASSSFSTFPPLASMETEL
jgi:hypothetical protein